MFTNAVVMTEIKLKQNKRKTMFCFSEIVLFQFYFRCNHCLSVKLLLCGADDRLLYTVEPYRM